MPRPVTPPPGSHTSRQDAYLVGILAFFSTVYVLLNRQPIEAAIVTIALWGLGIALYSVLSRGRWRLVIAYLIERRTVLRKLEQPVTDADRAKILDAKDIAISEQEQAEFAKLMGEAGFSPKWPE